MNSIYFFLKKAYRSFLIKFLQLSLISSLFFKICEFYLLSNNKSFSRRFFDSLTKNRYHPTNYEEGLNFDFDVTYIEYLYTQDHKNLEIMEVFMKIIKTYMKVFPLYFRNARPNEVEGEILKSVPELQDSNNHYCFLTSSAIALNAKIVIDIGTASGCSSVAFLIAENVEHVYSFDKFPLDLNRQWVSEPSFSRISTFLSANQSRWTQYVADLTIKSTFDEYKNILAQADIILIDINHSGTSESLLLQYLGPIIKKECLVIWDDIRISSMKVFWDTLSSPKLDVGSLGHNSGTGISLISGLTID